jgi:hypothetical protein
MKPAEVLPIFTSEGDFQGQVINSAKKLGWARVYHTHDSRKSDEGFPDLVLVSRRQRRVIFAELKNDTERERPEQKLWMDELGQCPGVEVYLWRFKDWSTVLELLAGRARPRRSGWDST